jgi:hydroxymethylpyrimidine/phosphomethylpyrimidine kinase
MLASAETIEVVAKSLKEHHVKTTIIDPVGVILCEDTSEF